jgi:hypothetical protein
VIFMDGSWRTVNGRIRGHFFRPNSKFALCGVPLVKSRGFTESAYYRCGTCNRVYFKDDK